VAISVLARIRYSNGGDKSWITHRPFGRSHGSTECTDLHSVEVRSTAPESKTCYLFRYAANNVAMFPNRNSADV
jgi:hypothetical protein